MYGNMLVVVMSIIAGLHTLTNKHFKSLTLDYSNMIGSDQMPPISKNM